MNNLMLSSVLSMAGLAVLFASVLAFADKKLKVKEDPRVDEINHLLPGLNCGGCGFLSCHDLAEHIVKEGADPARCHVISNENREKLFEIVGAEAAAAYPKVPLVHCAARSENKEPVAEYSGTRTCRSADLAFGGGMRCEYGCTGFGDCVDACPFGALRMENGLPEVDMQKCTSCGKCVAACPRDIISLQEKKHEKLFYVACSSRDGAPRVREICPVGCIACGICEKLSPEGFFKVTDNLSHPDYSKQDRREEIEKLRAKCPTKVIKEV